MPESRKWPSEWWGRGVGELGRGGWEDEMVYSTIPLGHVSSQLWIMSSGLTVYRCVTIVLVILKHSLINLRQLRKTVRLVLVARKCCQCHLML